ELPIMSICQSGIDCKTQFCSSEISIHIKEEHPIIRLAQSLPWREMADLVLPDLKNTKKGQWTQGRKLKLQPHLGAYLLQQFFNRTDRQIEYDIKDNAAYQIFCGRNAVEKWHVPDHTKIEKFRSRLSQETQRQLANKITQHAVKLGYGKANEVDVDSTVQEANMAYPADSCLLKKLGVLAHK